MSLAKTAVLFPGQGAYYQRALVELQSQHPEILRVFAEIDGVTQDLLGRRISDLVLTPMAKDLNAWLADDPDTLQLAIYGISVATYQILQRSGLRPSVLVGHSLGEIAALTCAGAFTVGAGAEIICHRNAILRDTSPAGAYMVAVGADATRAQSLLDLVGGPGGTVAVENHDGQTVLSGHPETLDRVAAVAAVLRVGCTRLKSPYPFHSPLLRPAVDQFAARIGHLRQGAPQLPVYSPILGRYYQPMDDLTGLLATHLVRRLRFADAIRTLYSDGVSVFVESGALEALTRIVGRVLAAADGVTTVATLRPDPGEGRSLPEALRLLSDAGSIAGALAGHQAVLHLAPEPVHLVPEPVEATVEAATETGGRSDVVMLELMSSYAEALEYPVDVFAPDTDLEAELGVDSVKQTELLARVSERYGLPVRPPEFRLGEYNTLAKIADLILTSAA